MRFEEILTMCKEGSSRYTLIETASKDNPDEMLRGYVHGYFGRPPEEIQAINRKIIKRWETEDAIRHEKEEIAKAKKREEVAAAETNEREEVVAAEINERKEMNDAIRHEKEKEEIVTAEAKKREVVVAAEINERNEMDDAIRHEKEEIAKAKKREEVAAAETNEREEVVAAEINERKEMNDAIRHEKEKEEIVTAEAKKREVVVAAEINERNEMDDAIRHELEILEKLKILAPVAEREEKERTKIYGEMRFESNKLQDENEKKYKRLQVALAAKVKKEQERLAKEAQLQKSQEGMRKKAGADAERKKIEAEKMKRKADQELLRIKLDAISREITATIKAEEDQRKALTFFVKSFLSKFSEFSNILSIFCEMNVYFTSEFTPRRDDDTNIINNLKISMGDLTATVFELTAQPDFLRGESILEISKIQNEKYRAFCYNLHKFINLVESFQEHNYKNKCLLEKKWDEKLTAQCNKLRDSIPKPELAHDGSVNALISSVLAASGLFGDSKRSRQQDAVVEVTFR